MIIHVSHHFDYMGSKIPLASWFSYYYHNYNFKLTLLLLIMNQIVQTCFHEKAAFFITCACTQGIFTFTYKRRREQADTLPEDAPLDTRIADLLLANGADINAPSLNESWVLMDAIDRADEKIARYLLANGANTQLKGSNKNA